MVFSLDSSLVLVAIVGLWLVWVAPFLLRRTTPDLAGTTHPTTHAGTRPPMESMMTSITPQDDRNDLHGATGTQPDAPAGPGTVARATPAWLVRSGLSHVHWGRLGIALVGALAVVSIPVTLLLAALGAVSLLVPLTGLVVAIAAVVTLRALAVRGRRARVERAFAEAMAPVRTAPVPSHGRPLPAVAVVRRPTTLFDADETPERPLTAMELRTAALAAAHGATAVDLRAADPRSASGADPVAGSAAWAPVDVPRPTYVDAAKAERPAPAPLDLPEAPKPTSKTPIKASEAAARFASVADDAESPVTGTAAPTGRINLDDVLQRRRA